jgi:hypothetical protein
MFGSSGTPNAFYFGTKPIYSQPQTPDSMGFTFGTGTSPQQKTKVEELMEAMLAQQSAMARVFLQPSEQVGNMFGKAGSTAKEYPVKTKSIGIFSANQTTQLPRPMVIIGFRTMFTCSNPLDPPVLDPATCMLFIDCVELSVNLNSQIYGQLKNIVGAFKANGLPQNQEFSPTFMLNQPTELTRITPNINTDTQVPIVFGPDSHATVCFEFLHPN